MASRISSGSSSTRYSATLVFAPAELLQLDQLTALLAAQDKPDWRLLSRPAFISRPSSQHPRSLLPMIERPGPLDLLHSSFDILHPQDLQPFPERPRHPPVALGRDLLLGNGAAPQGRADACMIFEPLLLIFAILLPKDLQISFGLFFYLAQ